MQRCLALRPLLERYRYLPGLASATASGHPETAVVEGLRGMAGMAAGCTMMVCSSLSIASNASRILLGSRVAAL